MEWLQDGSLTLNWERRKQDMDTSQSMSYTPKWSENSTTKTLSSILCVPPKEHYSVSLCWLIKWVSPTFSRTPNDTNSSDFFFKQVSEDLERKINLQLKCFSSKEQLTGFPWYFHINKDYCCTLIKGKLWHYWH